MTKKYGFFNDSQGDRQYGDTDFATMLALFAGEAGYIVGKDDELEVVSEGTGLKVTVSTGAALLGNPAGWWYINDEEFDINVDSETTGLYRIDRIVLRLDRSTENRKISIEVLKGIPGTSPIARAITQNEMLFEISLAQVYVTGGSTNIIVTDERQPIINSQSGKDLKSSDWTLCLRDRNKFIMATHASGITVTVPTNNNVPFPINTEIAIVQHGVGLVTINPEAGVTVCSLEGNLMSNGQYSGFTLRKISDDVWYAVGNLTTE